MYTNYKKKIFIFFKALIIFNLTSLLNQIDIILTLFTNYYLFHTAKKKIIFIFSNAVNVRFSIWNICILSDSTISDGAKRPL